MWCEEGERLLSDRKLENNILWFVCVILLSSLLTIILIMDYSTFPDFRLDLSAIAATLTSLVTLFTLFEIKKQRKKMYEPALAFGRSKETLHGEPVTNNLEIALYNVGFGSAINLQVEWDFYDKLNEIKKVYPDIDKDFIVLRDFLNERSGCIYNKLLDKRQEVDYLLPISVSDEPTKLRIPIILTNYVIFEVMKSWNENKDKDRGISIPEYLIPFKITYYDINNSKNIERYLMKFRVSMFSAVEANIAFSIEVIKK